VSIVRRRILLESIGPLQLHRTLDELVGVLSAKKKQGNIMFGIRNWTEPAWIVAISFVQIESPTKRPPGERKYP